VSVKALVGSGDKIALFTLPFVIVAVVLHVVRPSLFIVRGLRRAVKVLSVIMLIVGGITWAWSVALILIKVPQTAAHHDRTVCSGQATAVHVSRPPCPSRNRAAARLLAGRPDWRRPVRGLQDLLATGGESLGGEVRRQLGRVRQ
jgi:hypothetical protein